MPECGRLAASLDTLLARPREEAEVPRAFPDLPPGAPAFAGGAPSALDSAMASPLTQANAVRVASRQPTEMSERLLRHLLTPVTLTK